MLQKIKISKRFSSFCFRLYLLLLAGCLAGYVWIGLSMRERGEGAHIHPELCVIKNVTGVACPSCGTTRSVMEVVRGEFLNAGKINPLGYLVVLILVVVPPWIVLDFLWKRWTLYEVYRKTEGVLRIPWVAILLGGLVVLNWIWNISKDL
jgi:hypothetical protein